MQAKLRLDIERSIEVSLARLSPRYGCGLMLHNLPRYAESEMLLRILADYGYLGVAADKPARKIVSDSALLGIFCDNAFENKTPIRRNFYKVFGAHELFMACDPDEKSVWFVGEPSNKMDLVNYYRDSVSFGLKSMGLVLSGSVLRLTPMGWQNLHDLLFNDFFARHPAVKRIEVLTAIAGVRWREPCLGLGMTMLSLKDIAQIRDAVGAALAGENREDG